MIKKLVALLFLVGLIWCAGLAVYVGVITTIKPYEGTAEGIVVLTGGDGRIEAGLKILDDHPRARLLISGVHSDVKLKELLALNKGNAAVANRVELGFAAQDTLGNADETALWVERYQIESLIVVTAHYHMPRTLLHLGAQLPDVALYPYPVITPVFHKKDWFLDPVARRLIVHDYNKFLGTYPQILLLKHGIV